MIEKCSFCGRDDTDRLSCRTTADMNTRADAGNERCRGALGALRAKQPATKDSKRRMTHG